MRAGLLFVIALAACEYPVDLVLCTDGRACPTGTVCDYVHMSCATTQQLEVCADAPDATPCEAGALLGACHVGVCIARGCGNTVVESGEVCDDGNQVSDDGCRADCASDEGCGNAVRDAGEECDDGNAITGDGCDSICVAEVVKWKVQPSQPGGGGDYSNRTAFDPIRGRIIYVAEHVTWEWDGTQWHGIVHTLDYATVVYWNADRARVQVIRKASATAEVWEWDGAVWSLWVSLTNTPPYGEVWLAGYDPVRHHTLVIIASNPAYYMIDQNGTVTVVPAPPLGPGTSFVGSMVFDPNVNKLLVQGAGPILEFDGTSWTTSTADELPDEGGRLLYNEERGRIWIAGGRETSMSAHGNIYERALDGSWSLVPNVELPAFGSSNHWFSFDLIYDTVRDEVIHCLTPSSHGDVHRLDVGTMQWTHSRVGFGANQEGKLIADPLRRRMIYFGGSSSNTFDHTNDTWAWDGTSWVQLSSSSGPSPRVRSQGVYDATRGTVIVHGGYCGTPCDETWELVGSTWTLRESSGPQNIVGLAFAYDPVHRRVLAADGSGIWALPSDGSSWTRLHDVDYMSMDSMAWSARDGILTATESNGGVFDLVGEQWVRTLSPGSAYLAVEDQRSGSVLFAPSSYSTMTGQMWQRRGPSWEKIDSVPAPVSDTVAYDPSTGRLVFVGYDGGGSYVTVVRTIESASPPESCVEGEDRDGDAVAGCDDPDCWYACPAPCPPYATCQ